MKLCVTSQGSDLEAAVDPRFGRSPYFLIVDTDTGAFEAIPNPNVAGMGGVGIQAGQLMADQGVQALLTGHVGPNAFRTLAAAGIDVITGVSGAVGEAVARYKKGQLSAAGGPNVDPKFGAA